jgi:hypothetical protein
MLSIGRLLLLVFAVWFISRAFQSDGIQQIFTKKQPQAVNGASGADAGAWKVSPWWTAGPWWSPSNDNPRPRFHNGRWWPEPYSYWW